MRPRKSISESPNTFSTYLRRKLSIIGTCFALFGGLLLICVSNIGFFKSAVINVSDVSFFKVKNPPGFITQNPSSARLRIFRSQLPGDEDYRAGLRSAIKIRHWVRIQQPSGNSWKPRHITFQDRLRGSIDDPLVILAEQRNGAPANCRQLSYLMVGAIESIGMQARVLLVTWDFWKSYVDGHIMTEVWIPELSRWVLMDAMYDVMYTVNGAPASAVDIYDAVRLNKTYLVNVIGNDGLIAPVNQRFLERAFRHMYIGMTNALFDGFRVCFACEKSIQFAHLTNDYSPAYPTLQKRVALFLGGIALSLGVGILVGAAYLTRFRLADPVSTALAGQAC
jgi:hypothetical protein